MTFKNDNFNCVCGAGTFFGNNNFQPAKHSFLNSIRYWIDAEQKNSKAVCLPLNSSCSIYRLFFRFTAFRSCLGGVLIPAFSAGRGAPLSMSDDDFTIKRKSSLFRSSGAASADEKGLSFRSTATVGLKTRRAWALLSFHRVVTASIPLLQRAEGFL